MTHSQSVKVCAFNDAHVRARTSGGVLYVQVMTLSIRAMESRLPLWTAE